MEREITPPNADQSSLFVISWFPKWVFQNITSAAASQPHGFDTIIKEFCTLSSAIPYRDNWPQW
jgi:hypothetical protein